MTTMGQRPAREHRTQVRTCAICAASFSGTLRARYCSKRCEMKAYRERRAERERQPARSCRVCGIRGITVPLVAVPQDAGGGCLCTLCLLEGLRRAA